MTGATNVELYKYINPRGEWISNTWSTSDTVYTRILIVEKNDSSGLKHQVVKGELRELIRAK